MERAWQAQVKHLKRWYGGRLRQTIVEPCYCLDRVVSDGMSRISRRSEVGNTKRRILHNWQASGTSVVTFACPACPDTNGWAGESTKNWAEQLFCTRSKKGSENRSLHFRNQSFWNVPDFLSKGLRSTLLIKGGPEPFANEINEILFEKWGLKAIF